jgi:hypoxanthine-guanine phosphoribosyltransferase
VDTARSLAFIKDRLALAGARSIEVVTLFDKPYKRAVPIEISYIGKKDSRHICGWLWTRPS